MLDKIRLLFTYGPELEELLKEKRIKAKEKENLNNISRLTLCFKHRQEANYSYYSESNCAYCNLLKVVDELMEVKS